MPTCAGLDVGTRGIRAVYGRCPHYEGSLTFGKDEIEEALRFLKGLGVKKLCVAGGYQWREVEGRDLLSSLDEVVPAAGEEETHGFRRLLRRALELFDVTLLPSGGASGEVPEPWLINALDSGTPDKVAKANYVFWSGHKTFTLIDKGCFVSALYVVEGSITRFVSATRGMPGPCSPGVVDLELLLLKEWPRSRTSIMKSGVDDRTVEEWLRFYEPTFVGEKIVCPSPECDELAAAKGAFLWCCNFKLKNVFSDNFKRWVKLRD